jgi:p-cumate 2,3-dioxygenase subunit beta
MSAALLLRLSVEDFLYQEAALLDDWKLKEWLALFSPSARYEIAPTGDPDAGTLSSADALFLVADDRERLEQRVIRLQKPQAHAEYPHSRVRHVYSNVRILKDTGAQIEVNSNFVTFRNKRGITATYMGWHRYLLSRSEDS